MLTAYPEERTLRIQVKKSIASNVRYGAWVTPNGTLIQVTESEGHFNFAIKHLYPTIKNHNDLSIDQRNTFYVKMYNAGFLRLMYTKTGYTVERGEKQIIKMSQLSVCNNAESVTTYHHAQVNQ